MEEEEDPKAKLMRVLIDRVNGISSLSDFKFAVKKQYYNLARRLKLLIPMFEEIRESRAPIEEKNFESLGLLKEALGSAKDMLRFGSEGSVIYIVLEREHMMITFHEVTSQLEHALSAICYEELDISDEVKEQVELVLTQFGRANGRIDPPDAELYEDLLSLYNNVTVTSTDSSLLRKLTGKLQLTGIDELARESMALHEMVASGGEDPEERLEKMSMLLKKFKDFIQTDNLGTDPPISQSVTPCASGEASGEEHQKTPAIPDDFRCPISLELMKDPVIVSTGQTYERSCIEKWLEEGHETCPKTQQPLSSTALTPNYVLRSLISQWCEANGLEPPKLPAASRSNKTLSARSPEDHTKIEVILRKLVSSSPEDQRYAAGEIRLLAKRNADNRVAIAEAGAIPLLVGLLSAPDSRMQEHAVTAILNLSICEDNKGIIVSSGAVPGIVHVLKKGSMEARENAAAALFSLSVVDEYKVTIGASGAILPLVILLREGTQRGKKDAATALFNLCIYQGNRGKAVRAGLVPALMQLITEPEGGMVDEGLAILAIIASHSDGKSAIGAAEAVSVLVEFVGNGSSRNKENAAAILVHLFGADPKYIVEAQDLGIMGSLIDLSQNGTDRGKRKAAQLIERINRYVEQQKQATNNDENLQPSPTSNGRPC